VWNWNSWNQKSKLVLDIRVLVLVNVVCNIWCGHRGIGLRSQNLYAYICTYGKGLGQDMNSRASPCSCVPALAIPWFTSCWLMSVRSQHGAYVKLMSICRKMTQRPARTSYEWMVNHICIISDKVFQEYLFLFCCDIQWTKHLLTLILFIKVKVNTSTSAHTFSIYRQQSVSQSQHAIHCLFANKNRACVISTNTSWPTCNVARPTFVRRWCRPTDLAIFYRSSDISFNVDMCPWVVSLWLQDIE